MILVTGGNGMVGHALKKVMPDAIYLGRKDFDLSNMRQCVQCFQRYEPDTVIHLAAKVGGIVDNSSKQYDYFYDNVTINTNVVHCCNTFKVYRLIAMSSTCSYPRHADTYPMQENYVHNGLPEATNLSYAYAKRMLQIQVDAARKQFGYKWVTIYSGNLYGPHDSFEMPRCHVIPSLINKIYSAKKSSDKSIELLGSGKELRQFTYVSDLAKVTSDFTRNQIVGDFNFSYPDNVSIDWLSATIADIIGFDGKIVFTGKLSGVDRKDVDVSLLRSVMSLPVFTNIRDGIKKTYEWYLRSLKCGI